MALKDGKILAPDDISSQTKLILNEFKETLERAGSDLNHVCTVYVYITNVEMFNTMNEVYQTVCENKEK